MPSVKDFDNKAKKSSDKNEDLDLDTPKKSKGARRRPGRDEDEVAASADEAVTEATEAFDSFNPPHLEADHETLREFETAEPEEKEESPFKHIHIPLFGGHAIDFDTPEKIVEIADTLVKDWKNDGPFESLPLGNPLAQLVAAKGLRKAKDLEKKLEEKGVFAMAQMGLAVLKSKIKKD